MNLEQTISKKICKTHFSEILFNKKCIVSTFNPHSYILAKYDNIFEEALLKSDVLLPDGIGIVLASKIFNISGVKKIAGADLHDYLLEKANNEGLKVFYLGTTTQTLQNIIKRVKRKFTNIQVTGFAPPFKLDFSKKESDEMINAVNTFRPDILFVGMSAPKQEKWVYLNKGKLNSKIIASIGAVFDFYAGTVKRPGIIWIKLGLEWLPRLLREPKRLWRRNFISSPLFLWEVLKEKFE